MGSVFGTFLLCLIVMAMVWRIKMSPAQRSKWYKYWYQAPSITNYASHNSDYEL
jgi:hypothetical protein